VADTNASGGTYHRLDLGDGLVIEGMYDMDQYVHHYNIPTDLRGQTVLDVGTASGYFALLCARRGAKVIALDVWDEPLIAQLAPLVENDISYVKQNVYELDKAFGSFDLVLCGSLLLHLSDPLGALRKLHEVCKERAIISTACTLHSATNPDAVCEFVGQRAADGDYWTYWNISAAALSSMCNVAGFAGVDHVEHFTLVSERDHRYVVPHVVLTAWS
jgi:tRNA (mo5U34)-methyltransferase